MTEELDDEKRTWYLKGYAQAEADQEVLIKKLMKDISDLSAERIGWINESGLFRPEIGDMLFNSREKAILDCVTIAWDAPEPDGGDIAIRIAESMGYKIALDDTRIRLEIKE